MRFKRDPEDSHYYESCVVIKNTLDEEMVAGYVSMVDSALKKDESGGTYELVKVENCGPRTYKCSRDQRKKCHYIVFYIKSQSGPMKMLDRYLNLSEHVICYRIISVKDVPEGDSHLLKDYQIQKAKNEGRYE